jgi:HNH endonuclease
MVQFTHLSVADEAAWQMDYHERGNRRQVRKTTKLCPCGKPVAERHNKYCPDCIAKRVYNKQFSKLALEELKSDKSRRKWLIQRRGNQCEVCGISMWRGELVPLELHHVDGNTDHNTEENLKLLCPNCHAQMPTFRRKNALKEGKRQVIRRKRYSDGETWYDVCRERHCSSMVEHPPCKRVVKSSSLFSGLCTIISNIWVGVPSGKGSGL